MKLLRHVDIVDLYGDVGIWDLTDFFAGRRREQLQGTQQQPQIPTCGGSTAYSYP
jgi:hypothetical protein